jgi:tRNA nucleotidyltransferase (CCA-adding enzyme)
MCHMSLEQEILDRIKPDESYRTLVDETVFQVMEAVRREIEGSGLEIEVLLVGSVAKDTYIPAPDIDIFMMFPETTPRMELERKGLELGRKVLGGEERYAEHPYIRGLVNGLGVDLVPCYAIADTSRMKSAVDRTPFHTKFVKSHLREGQKDQVRLLKRFMKGIGVYGAEARVEGFSGYLTELLVLRYGDFRSVLEAATQWSYATTLYLEQRGETDFNSPLVFYDPVDLDRNVASALSTDCFALFIQASREYLEREREEFFFPRTREPLSMPEIQRMMEERGTSPVVVRMARPGLTDDNLFPQVKKTLEGILSLLRGGDFEVLDSAWHVDDETTFALELKAHRLPVAMMHAGPPVWIEHSERFLDKWRTEGLSRPFIRNGRWMVMARREHPDAKELLISDLDHSSLGSGFRRMEGLSVQEGAEVFAESNRRTLSALLDKRKNWEV